ncbi:MAG TPA: hypothetical protein VGH28_02665 [Polyangiaceae bacterium]|jgi:hypothetical protein
MKTLALVALGSLMSLACSAPADSGDDAPVCSASGGKVTTVFEGLDAYDAISVEDGFVYVEVPSSGVERCATTGCTGPSPVVSSDAFVSATFGQSVTYTTQILGDDGTLGGEVRSVGLDGSGDTSLFASAVYPDYVATSGARTFWAHDSFAVDDTPATVECVGCGATGSTPWIMGLGGGTYGVVADASRVFVLADDASLTSVSLLSCGVSAPCFGEPTVLLTGLDRTASAQQIASDGTNVYVARAPQSDVVRIDPSGAVTPIVTSKSVSALAFDAASGQLYYGTQDGEVGKLAPDGSSQPTSLACTGATIAGVAVDDASVYFITGPSGSMVAKIAK